MKQTSLTSPFHSGERKVQSLVGVRESSENLGQRIIHDNLPGAYKAFLSRLPFVLIGSVDGSGRPWASMLMGRPGFIDIPDAHTLTINTRRISGDPLDEFLVEGADVGLLGIEYQSRRRVRVAAKVAAVSDDVILLRVVQTFGNCPQYIQARDHELLAGIDTLGEPLVKKKLDSLDDRAKEIIAAADHFYIASHYSQNVGDTSHGADVSHRGGKPGFVRIESDSKLIFPDFYGNNMFNTIGNIIANPRAGLLFIDFENGDLLLLTCRAEIIWDSEEQHTFVGAERFVRLAVVRGLLIEKAVPIRWGFLGYSPSLASTGSWQEISD
jgi:predicted pyridoxine 5'-phosphate oxidase superfamily flavin-nucleotide-binding protein